ncbi:GST-containing FLYWCH zinc-finger protein [Anticarsia gemmatalis]|uniref:GST-containing FLYWCH zinc-finger protein n=1 Tax=Anticarsia gemmatalis TaxID=129554 RepID=UPI003F769347
MVLKLYAVADGPPSLACRQVLAALNVLFELVDVNFNNGDHMTDEYAKLNPQKEIPVLVDDGFCLGESVAIMQYVCDKYAPDSPLYPREPQARALVNHRLLFNLTTYYASISAYTMAPIFFDYPRTAGGLKRIHMVLDVFETYLGRTNTSYAAGDSLTIADFPLVNTTMTLEAVNLDFSKYPKINKWYNDFKKNHPDLWKISADGMKEIQYFEANPPDLSHLNHPIHPARKANK